MGGVSLDVRRISKRFGRRTVVRDLSFTAWEGDVVGLLGPNGAGKTTTIRLLTTLLEPSSGEFSVAGIPSTRPAEIRRQVGVLPESAGYPAHQTGEEYLRYHARLFGQSRRDAARVVHRLLAEVDLDEHASSRISTYSRGMRQRLGLARALVNEPRVVFLDEPTAGLDPAGQRQVLGIVRQIAHRRGATVVLSSHTLPEVEEICTNVLILDRGAVIVDGTVSELTAMMDVQSSAQIRVPIDQVGAAREALAGVADLMVEPETGRPDVMRLRLTEPASGQKDRVGAGMNEALLALLGADVSVLSFDVAGARLSDAFLTMTGDGAR